ncbi:MULTISPECIES: BTAD domain-containing putative transcriptional regulator [Nocardia]|uniref:BTAD domain-containing putative transcriptional regulator n=1 Tax=Nocardia TaxID=1817 RepID=UPI0024537AD5|nr:MULTISPECIES: BTAD domain-containing putative transcriptional regulator [Nocardia]
MRFGVLGPLTVWTDAGAVVPIPGAKVRALLADLLVTPGQPVSGDRLVDDIWADDPPGNPAGTLAAKASQLRRALEDAEPGGRDLVVSPPPGYRLATSDIDAQEFRALMASARAATEPAERVRALTAAVAVWRGPAFADFRDAPFAQPAIAQLEEQRLVAVEELAEARLSLGEYREVAGELAAFVAAHPLRERLRAAHLRALYGAGRQAEALDGFEDLRRRLDDELGIDPGPQLAALHRAILEQDLPLAAPPPETVVTRRRTSNVPAQRTELIGRDADLAQVCDAVATARLVTLTGPGGVGKTRLSLAAAAALTERFAHGSWLVELGALQPTSTDGTSFLADAVAGVLGISAADGADFTGLLCDALSDRELLLVLDNCEHVVDRAAELAESLLGAAPGLHILATGREPLRLPGEDIVALEPLEVPARDAGLDEIARTGAVRLFVTRARAGARDFVLDADTAAPVATLCRRLDGIPLALELAATRVRALGVHEIVARLDNRFKLLATGHRGVPPRQQTLAAMIDWSWGLLDATEQAVLRRLAVHTGGCTLAAAEAVCSGEGAATVDESVVADVIARLVDRSLVHMAGRRYRLLESVAAFGLDRLADAGEFDATHLAHHRYHLRLAERAEPELYGADQRRWLRWLDEDTANLRAALDGFVRAGAADRALRLVNALAWYWQLRGRLSEARRWLDAALALGGSPPHRARALAWSVGFAFQQGEFGAGAAERAAVLALYDTVDDPAGRARAELFLGSSALESGDVTESESLLRKTLPVFEELGDRWGVAAGHVALAKAAHNRVDLAALERHARTAARLFAELDDRWGRLQAAEWLGGLAELTGDLAAAADIHAEALGLAQELELWGQACTHLSWMGWIAMQNTDFDRARALGEQAQRIAAEHGYEPGRLFAAVVLAFTARRGGRSEIAEQILRELLALPLAEGAETPLFLPMLQVELGYIHERRDDPAAAFALYLNAFDGAQRIGAPRDTAFALAALASALAGMGEPDTAARLLGAAAAVREINGIALLPAERPDIDRPANLARTALGDRSFIESHTAGTRLSPLEARELAAFAVLEVPGLPPAGSHTAPEATPAARR